MGVLSLNREMSMCMNGYYRMTWDETMELVVPVKPLPEVYGYLLTEQDAEKLPIGALFTGKNGVWYIVVGNGDYRRWTWESSQPLDSLTFNS